jgi:endo-1,4-beta-xylanase
VRRQFPPDLITLFATAIVSACGGGGGPSSQTPNLPPITTPAIQLPDASGAPALKTEFAPYFKFGAAVETSQVDPTSHAADVRLLKKHFDSITPANAMKADVLSPREGQYNFDPADAVIAFAQANGIAVRAHTLLWYQTAPDWFFAGDRTDPNYRETVRQRLRQYITDVVTHFKGKLYAWDVVNEVIGDTDTSAYRTQGKWYEAYSAGGAAGEDYIEDAFRAARAADPDLMKVLKDLSDKAVPLDGVGHQMHSVMSIDPAAVDTTLTAIEQFNSSLINEITELDVSVYIDPLSCYISPPQNCSADYGLNGPSLSALSQQAQTYRSLFAVFRKHDASIDSVTTWGISDAQTWLNYWPIDRTDRPLLFDRNGNPKWAFWAIVDPTIKLP